MPKGEQSGGSGTRPQSEPGAVRVCEVGGEELLVIEAPGSPEVPDVHLTEAEREVLAGVVDGLDNEQLARERGVSKSTIANQIATLMRKLGVGSRWELVARVTGARGD